MSDTKKFPAIGLLVVLGVGSAAAAVSLAGFGWLMVKQGLTQEAAAPLATAAVCDTGHSGGHYKNCHG